MAKLISADLTNNKLCVLEYTTTDGQMLPIDHIDIDYELFDGKMVSHTYTDIGRIIFKEPITTVRVRAFYGCSNLTSITIPDSVIDIGTFAFSGCRNLTSITIGNSVTRIGEYAFNSCDSLTNVYISDIAAWCNISFVSAQSNPLYYKGNLYLNNKLVTDLTIPDSVTAIRIYAFYMCNNLTSVTIGNGVTRIGKYAFYMCNNLTSVTIGNGVTRIGKSAFKECNIDTIVCCSEIPPKIDNSFDKFEILIVPTYCEEAYANSDWGKYL